MTLPSDSPSAPGPITNPYLTGLWPVLVLTGLGALAFLGVAGLVLEGFAPRGALVLAGLPPAFFGLIAGIGWLLGERQAAHSREFLTSDRPQVRWTYTAAEWAALREARWREARSDRWLPVAGLAFLLGLAGLITGGLLGMDNLPSRPDAEELFEAGVTALSGALAGATVGGAIGAAVALGNSWAAQLDYRQTVPGTVAFGEREISALGRYVRLGDGPAELTQVAWEREDSVQLLLRFRINVGRRTHETWAIAVPGRVLAEVEGAVRQLEQTFIVSTGDA